MFWINGRSGDSFFGIRWSPLMPSFRSLLLLFLLGFCALVIAGCSAAHRQSASMQPSVATTPFLVVTTAPRPRRQLFRPIAADAIPNSQIDAHIPRNTNPADRKIVKQVMLMLPPRLRQYVTWLHVPPRNSSDYTSLPNHGLVVVFDDPLDNRHQDESSDLPGLYVLFFGGTVQPDTNSIYDAGLDSYLTPVPTGFKEVMRGRQN